MSKEKSTIDPTTRLAVALEKQNSYWNRFGLGIVTGLGTAIGATLIFALVLFWAVQFLQSIGWEERLRDWGIEFDTLIEQKLDAEVESRLRR